MKYFKPWTTLALDIVIGYVAVPKVMQRIG